MAIKRRVLEDIEYPSSDGKPMSDNTRQFQWIVTIQGGLDALFKDDPNVFVAGDLLWYPVEGYPKIRRAPDAMVAIGRPKGHRGAYLQWREGGIAPQVVFEVLSPKNTAAEMAGKLAFYDTYGAEEYYLYDPDGGELTGWRRNGEHLQLIPRIEGWVSPRLGVRFGLRGDELVLENPDGTPFLSYLELARRREAAEQQAGAAAARARAERERAEAERERAEAERERADRLAARLRELGIDPESV
jgi:Uma2 family endonuclease